MPISTYHIHNVLRTYTKQLGRDRSPGWKKGVARPRGLERISISAKARRKAVMEKVTTDIVNRIIQEGARNGAKGAAAIQPEGQVTNGLSTDGEGTALVFKVIDKEKGEETKTLLREKTAGL
jgi:hypothetical protein